jgi:maleate isomerase
MAGMSTPPLGQVGVGVVVPHDMALDRELWRWVPSDVSLMFTRTAHSPSPVTVELVAAISDPGLVAGGVRSVTATAPAVCAYACASGSFVRGVAGERALVAAMCDAGAVRAVTTSGALLAALSHLRVSTVAVATPYDATLTGLLGAFLGEAGVTLAGSAHLGLTADIWQVPYETTADLVRRADRAEAEAVFVSCTNLPTYDLVAALEAELGKPVLTANQVTMWACLQAIGRRGVGPGQRLLDA